MSYRVETTYLVHDGGTKFYETVLIVSDGTAGAMLIKRYGPLNKLGGGGQTIVETGGASSCRDANFRILAEKKAMRSGKGQYVKTDGNYGLQRQEIQHFQTDDGLKRDVGLHYYDQDIAKQMSDFFSPTSAAAAAPAVVTLSEPEPVRDERWGSW